MTEYIKREDALVRFTYVVGNFVCSCAHWSGDGYTVYTKPDDFCSYGERGY